jgi:hypothetical protein
VYLGRVTTHADITLGRLVRIVGDGKSCLLYPGVSSWTPGVRFG